MVRSKGLLYLPQVSQVLAEGVGKRPQRMFLNREKKLQGEKGGWLLVYCVCACVCMCCMLCDCLYRMRLIVFIG